MNETPETADRARTQKGRERSTPLASLDEAFRRYRTPPANQVLIRRIVESTDVASLVGFDTYFRVNRRGGGPALEVHAGYTNGFRSESDVMRRAGETERWPSRRFQGAWGVTHPEAAPVVEKKPARRSPRQSAPRQSAPRPSARQAAPERPEAICPTCFMVLPATGICDTCDA
ncbi:hypothetical protein [Microbacterium karelineae]|uniref:hypothetical protein n=1 Tax=Microbacterium karelineae TaxID=2654283 RepID=UPI0012EAE5A9|nr:hypothetical protein [Microbacterium karelineae]